MYKLSIRSVWDCTIIYLFSKTNSEGGPTDPHFYYKNCLKLCLIVSCTVKYKPWRDVFGIISPTPISSKKGVLPGSATGFLSWSLFTLYSLRDGTRILTLALLHNKRVSQCTHMDQINIESETIKSKVVNLSCLTTYTSSTSATRWNWRSHMGNIQILDIWLMGHRFTKCTYCPYCSLFLVCYGCDTSDIVSIHIQCQASILILSLCRGHSWWVQLAKQETLTPPGHLVSPLVCRGPWMSSVLLYCRCHSDSVSVLLYFTFCHTCSLCRVELVVQFPARGSTQVILCLFPGVLWLWHFLYSVGPHPVTNLHIYTFVCVASIHGGCG